MKINPLYFVLLTIFIVSCNDDQVPAPDYKNPFFEMPEEKWGGLYHELQMWAIVDNKDLADAIPKRDPQDIYNDLRRARNNHDFEMESFLLENFEVPSRTTDYTIDKERSINESVDLLWRAYQRPADGQVQKGSSLIPLPNPFFTDTEIGNDVVYWSAFYSIVGLIENGKTEEAKQMVANFAYLIDEFGFIPYNNRTYNTSRSHFPMFVGMLDLLESIYPEIYQEYLPQLEKEYQYWMKHADKLTVEDHAIAHVALYQDKVLNRFWDDQVTARPEHYRNDYGYTHNDSRPGWEVIREIRAVTESGWNHSMRYMWDRWRGTLYITQILPIDLNAVMYQMELKIGEAYAAKDNTTLSKTYNQKAESRKNAINQLFWDEDLGIYKDIEYRDSTLMDRETLATAYPLFFKISDQAQADSVARFLEEELLEDGGLKTSTKSDRQRWDGSNGWPHLQYIAYYGLKNYGHDELADEIARRWVEVVEKTYQETGRFHEYYNADDISDNYDNDRDTLNYAVTVAVYEAMKEEVLF